MKKIFTLIGGLLLASSLNVNAEEVTVYISNEDGDEIAYNFDADLTKDDSGVYTLANLFDTSETTHGIPFSFKFDQPEVGKSSPIEVTSNLTAIEGEGWEGYYTIKNSNDKKPIFWIYDLNGIDDWVRLRSSYIYLGADGSNVYRYDMTNPDNTYEYVATFMISGTFNGLNPETGEYDKVLFTGEGEEAPWLYVEFWFNEPKAEGEDPEPEPVLTQTIDVTVETDAWYYPDYNDEDTYQEKTLKPFDAKLDIYDNGTYTLRNIFGSDYSISYTYGKFNPKNQALVTFTGNNLYRQTGYESYPYILTPDGNYMTVNVEDEESGEKMAVDYLQGCEGSSTYIYKCTADEIAEGYYEYYVYMYLDGYINEIAELDMIVCFGYDITTDRVSVVDVKNAPVEYYNLNGQRVADPSNGIFIRRQGNQTSKIAIK